MTTQTETQTPEVLNGQRTIARIMPWGAIAGLLVVLPILLPGTSMISTLNYLGIMAIFALSYNVMLGQTGLLSLGHGTFFGLGGFFVSHAVLQLAAAGINFPLPLIPLIGGIGAFVLGIVGGWLAAGRGGMPFAMITLGLGELVYAAANIFPSIYGSEEGVPIDRMDVGSFAGFDFGSQLHIYGIVAIWFFICAIGLKFLTLTPLGLLSNAVRDNSDRIEFLGFSARRVRLSSYAIAAGVAGIAGGLAAINFEIMTINELGAGQSTLVLLMTYIGGTRIFYGPVLGAIVIGLMKIWLSDLTSAWMMYFGLLFIFVVMVAPGGLAGILSEGFKLMRSGQLKAQLPLLSAIAAVGALCLAGIIILVELAYRAGLDAALGYEITVLWLPMNAASALSWGLGIVLLLGGIWGVRALLDQLATLRHQLGTKSGENRP